MKLEDIRALEKEIGERRREQDMLTHLEMLCLDMDHHQQPQVNNESQWNGGKICTTN